MELTLSVDLDEPNGDTNAEVGRILRYWGRAAEQLGWTQLMGHAASESEYKEVGLLRTTEG